LNVEYLVLIDSKEPLCLSIKSLNNLIQAYDGINIDNHMITFSGCTFGYNATFDQIGEDNQRYFHLTLSLIEPQNEEKFSELLRLLRVVLSKISDRQPEVLWDDIASQYSEKAYPLLHYTENLLRKLITKFMFTNLGLKWTKEAIPSEVENSIKSKKSDRASNYLYQLDFSQLSNLLFKEYSTGNIKQINKKIATATSIEGLDINELKELIPISNWQRYFSPIVNCESLFLKNKWSRLYELRCKVAHNKHITIEELEEIVSTTEEINKVFNEAVQKLSKVSITEEQKEEIAENLASTSNELFAEFIQKWDKLLSSLRELIGYHPIKEDNKKYLKNSNDWRELVDFLVHENYLNDDFTIIIKDIDDFKYQVIHRPVFMFSDSCITNKMALIDDLKYTVDETMEGIAIGYSRMRDGC
jgi:hypothetical protein